MNWFEDRSEKEKKTAVKNVIVVMAADGKIEDSEMSFLATVCKRVGVSPAELSAILSDVNKVEFVLAENQKERVFQLMDIVLMMLADGKIDPKEMTLCAALAAKLGFEPLIVPKLVASIVEGIQRGNSQQQVGLDVQSYLNS